jgi:CBS-domain-containing membrane protein
MRLNERIRMVPKNNEPLNSGIPRRNLRQMLDEFRRFWKHYVFQSAMATFSVFVLLLIFQLQNMVITASVGATAFIIFAMPNNLSARARNIIGGHMIGFFSGCFCALIPHSNSFLNPVIYAFAVGLSMLLMVIFDMEHPPACATALGAAISGFSWPLFIALLTASLLFSIIHRLCRGIFHDLV